MASIKIVFLGPNSVISAIFRNSGFVVRKCFALRENFGEAMKRSRRVRLRVPVSRPEIARRNRSALSSAIFVQSQDRIKACPKPNSFATWIRGGEIPYSGHDRAVDWTNKPGWGWQRKKWCKSKATAINLSESHCRGSKINVAFLTRMSWKLRARNSSPWQYRQGPCPIGGINAGIFLWQPIYSNNAAYQ